VAAIVAHAVVWPGTPAEEKLRLLASWSATVDQPETTPVNDRA
jgi:hypothetical protein